MGLVRDGVAFLLAARRLGASFEETLMIGRQGLMVDHARLRAAFADNGLELSRGEAGRLVRDGRGYAEPLLRHLGAAHVDSLDVDGFEGCTICHDLNQPLPPELRERYSAVIDGGTLEHVFNYPAALGSAMQAVRRGGHLVILTPVDGYAGHGFYQVSPELFYRALSRANGFETVCVLLKPMRWRSSWRRVPDPAVVGDRIYCRTAWPALLFVLARRVEIVPLMQQPPMQSDYESAWRDAVGADALTSLEVSRPVAAAIRLRMPLPAKEIRESLRTWSTTRPALPRVKLADLRGPEVDL